MKINLNTIKTLKNTLSKISMDEFSQLYQKMNSEEHRKSLIVAYSWFSLGFFSRFFFSDIEEQPDGTLKRVGHTKDPPNSMHNDYFQQFNPDEQAVQKVILASRGSSKTTLIALIDSLHRVCFSTEKYILLLSSTSPLGRAKAKDIHSEIELNRKLKYFFELDFTGKRQSKESFEVSSSFGKCFIHAQGYFSQVRGLKHGAERPTRIIYDDVTHGERVFSETQRQKAERQFFTDIKNAAQPKTSHVFIGTTIHADDLVTKLSKNPLWRSSTYKAIKKWPKNMDLWDQWEQLWTDNSIKPRDKESVCHDFYINNKEKMDEGAEVLWPEREPLYLLMKERMTIGRRAFGAEKQMEPFLSGESLFKKIYWFKPIASEKGYGFEIEHSKKFVRTTTDRFQYYYSLDPATGERKKQTQKKVLSQSARLIVARDYDTGRLYVIRAIMDRSPPSEVIREMFDLHEQYDFVRMGSGRESVQGDFWGLY